MTHCPRHPHLKTKDEFLTNSDNCMTCLQAVALLNFQSQPTHKSSVERSTSHTDAISAPPKRGRGRPPKNRDAIVKMEQYVAEDAHRPIKHCSLKSTNDFGHLQSKTYKKGQQVYALRLDKISPMHFSVDPAEYYIDEGPITWSAGVSRWRSYRVSTVDFGFRVFYECNIHADRIEAQKDVDIRNDIIANLT